MNKKRKSPSAQPSGARNSPSVTQQKGSSAPAEKEQRIRPTNNQLLYKAHLRWEHYPGVNVSGLNLPRETSGYPSVTSAFLRVVAALQKAEEARCGRSILQVRVCIIVCVCVCYVCLSYL